MNPNENDRRLRARLHDLPAMSPDPEFRARCKQQFVEGTLPRVLESPPSREHRLPSFLRWGGLAAAAAVLAVVLFFPPWAAPSWRVVALPAGTSLLIDGRSHSGAEAVGIEIPAGARVEAGHGGEVTLGVEGATRFVLAPHTEISVGAERPWFGRAALTASVRDGMTWCTTGKDFPAGGLTITTTDAEVRITGTTFSVSCWPDTTCICVLEGKVEVTPLADGETRKVPPRKRLYVSHRPVPPTMVDLPQGQVDKLSRIRDLGAPSGL